MKNYTTQDIHYIVSGRSAVATQGSFIKAGLNPCFCNDLIYPNAFSVCSDTCPLRMTFEPMHNRCWLSRGMPYA